MRGRETDLVIIHDVDVDAKGYIDQAWGGYNEYLLVFT